MEGQGRNYYIDVPIPSIYENAVFLIATKWQSTKEDPRMNFKCRIVGFLIFTQKNSGEDLFEIVSIDFLNLKGFLKDSNFPPNQSDHQNQNQ